MADLPPEVDPTTIPAVMPRSVSLIDAAGKPLQALLNWFQALNSWFAKTAVDLQTKITMVNSETEGNTATAQELVFAFTTSDAAYAGRLDDAVATSGSNSANISALQFAITTSDSAFAGRIDTAETQAAGGTANGQVYLVAQAAPSGWTAAYGIVLTAPSLTAGMQILVDTATSTSAIMFTASQFMLVDPAYLGGAPQTVFDYTGGVFRFLVPVLVGNQELDDNAATRQWVQTSATDTVSQTGVTWRGTGALEITAQYYGNQVPVLGVDIYIIRIFDHTGGSPGTGTQIGQDIVVSKSQGGAGGPTLYTSTWVEFDYAPPTTTARDYSAKIVNISSGIPNLNGLRLRIREYSK